MSSVYPRPFLVSPCYFKFVEAPRLRLTASSGANRPVGNDSLAFDGDPAVEFFLSTHLQPP